MKELSNKYSEISPSMTLEISARAKAMKAEGIDVISFSVGEPDFNTPENIRKIAIDRINRGGIGYTDASGIPLLKEVICSKLKENNLEYQPNQIVVSNGAKHSLSNALQAICNPGDEVIIQAPYWVSYYELIKMAGALPAVYQTTAAENFKMDPMELEFLVAENTKAILLNSPSNPTGVVYTAEELLEIGRFAYEHDLYIISDEIYEKLVYGVEHVSIASLSPQLYERTIVINGVSKAYAMTGWRLGYSASSPEIAKMMANIQSHQTSNPNTISQYAAIEALMGDQSEIENMRVAFEGRRDLMVSLLDEVPGIGYVRPDGAFYVMVDISGFKNAANNIETSVDFAARLLEEKHVAVIPGIAFGNDDYIRLSYATSNENIERGITKIAQFLSSLQV